jgi:Tfp pilus assembly protein PilN
MINLMPPELKTGYVYARRNVTLRKWVIAFLIALVGLGVFATYGLLTIKQSTNQYSKEIAATQESFKQQNSDAVQKRVQDISNNFKLVVKVLGQEVLFSQMIKQVAAIIPYNANLTGLDINQTSGGIDITADATDYKTATQIQVNLSDPGNKIFSKADIVSINCNNATNTLVAYPCTVNIRALFAADNPFLFINDRSKQ